MIGSLHVGLRESIFARLLGEFRLRLTLIALGGWAMIMLLSVLVVGWLFPFSRRRSSRRRKADKESETPD